MRPFLIFFLWTSCIFSQEAKVFSTNEIDSFPWFNGMDCYDFDLGSSNCFKIQMDNHIAANFNYPIDAIEKKLTGKAYVQFTIDSIGIISNIKARGTHKTFEQEAIRIIEKIPPINPAKLNEKKVSVYYNLPISFNLKLDGNSLSKTKELIIDANKKNPIEELISYEEVAKPPIYKGCEDTKDIAKCFKSEFTKDLSDFVIRQNPKAATISAKVFFEITAQNEISQLLVVSENPSSKKLIERFFSLPSKILSAASNDIGENVNCFFNSELNLLRKERQRKTIRN